MTRCTTEAKHLSRTAYKLCDRQGGTGPECRRAAEFAYSRAMRSCRTIPWGKIILGGGVALFGLWAYRAVKKQAAQ